MEYLVFSNDYLLYLNEEGRLMEHVNSISVSESSDCDFDKDVGIRSFIQDLFKEQYQNVACLLGAGASIQHGHVDMESEEAPERGGLWASCRDVIEEINNKSGDETLAAIDGDIEKYLSRLHLLNRIQGGYESELKKIENIIKRRCDIQLGSKSPQEGLICKLTARKNSASRIEVYTTNYDTLIEQAASVAGCIVIDGFSYAFPRKFSGRYFDYDFVDRGQTRLPNGESYVQRVIKLYKIHGSLNWIRKGDDIIQKNDMQDEPLVVYPASDKYESSYEQPYFEMMSRFQMTLRKESVRLIVCGFGFADKHIQNVIIEAVFQNPDFQLVIVDYSNDGCINLKKYSKLKLVYENKNNEGGYSIHPNVVIIFSDFAQFVENIPNNKAYDEGYEEK